MTNEQKIIELLLIKEEVLAAMASDGPTDDDPLEINKFFVELHYDYKIGELATEILLNNNKDNTQ